MELFLLPQRASRHAVISRRFISCFRLLYLIFPRTKEVAACVCFSFYLRRTCALLVCLCSDSKQVYVCVCVLCVHAKARVTRQFIGIEINRLRRATLMVDVDLSKRRSPSDETVIRINIENPVRTCMY